MRVYQHKFLVIVFISGVFPNLTIEELHQHSRNLSTEDRERLELLKLADITRKGLRLVIIVNKTKDNDVEPRVYEVLKNFSKKIKSLKDEIILLRDEIIFCGDLSNISTGNSWKEVFNYCINNTDAELYAVTILTNVISVRAKIIKDLKYELRLKPVDGSLLKKAIVELNWAQHQLKNEDILLKLEGRRTQDQIKNELIKLEKTFVLASHFLQIQLHRLENPKEIVTERLLGE